MATRPTPLVTSILRHLRNRPPTLSASHPLTRTTPQPPPPRLLATPLTPIRFRHSIPRPQPKEWNPKPPTRAIPPMRTPQSKTIRPNSKPAYYQLTFTCIPCETRSQHQVSKQAYHHGSALITCPECRNRHVISDHLGIFGDRKITVEDLVREKGQLVKRGSLGEDGDIEFWVDEKADERKEGEESKTTSDKEEGDGIKAKDK